jgi:hypothetical protein
VTFFFLLVGVFALVHVPPLARLLGAPTRREKMRVAAGIAFIVARRGQSR